MEGRITLTREQLDHVRRSQPQVTDHLWNWVRAFLGVRIPRQAVCPGHSAPFDLFAEQVLSRPSISVWHGPRGSGKSYLSAIDTHVTSRFNPRHGTKILGGSKAQSEQIYNALRDLILDGRGDLGGDRDSILRLLKTEATYINASHVSILTASTHSVRGPHVPSLKLDEVDEIDDEIREAAFGMAMELKGSKASVLMTSTWHKVAGPMAELIEKGRAGEFPVHSFCVFEVLERCPDERSGPNLEHCGVCPLVRWCHADCGGHQGALPRAKRSDGHYSIDSLIQKVKGTSPRVFASDYLCQGPKAEGIWFRTFDESRNVTSEALYDPALPVHLAIDCGVFTGAVVFQVKEIEEADEEIPWSVGGRIETPGGVIGIHREKRIRRIINVFADYLSEGIPAEENARALMGLRETLCGEAIGRRLVVSMDSAGGARNPVGPPVIAEYQRVGLQGSQGILQWPKYAGCVTDGLALMEAFIKAADDSVSLFIHPRCKHLIQAIQSYARARRGGQWMDYPADPQHPHEDLVDALRGGLSLIFPEGRKVKPKWMTANPRNVL